MFTFSAGGERSMIFSFATPSTSTEDSNNRFPQGIKRCRPLTDVEGGTYEVTRRKKRRLRRILITSRLSEPYSFPPTHIIDRGSSKIAVWAKQKSLGRNLLRKSAILNRIKRHAMEAKRLEQKHLEIARQVFIRHASYTAQIPRRLYIPLPPSPLGLSIYDALDADDDFEDEETSDIEWPPLSENYAILDPADPLTTDYDFLDEPPPPFTKGPPSLPNEEILEQLRDTERQRELLRLAIR
ncbi:MAG: hypothetical protein M1814_003084 [Vezdaea aestivalis]|nr:MAG: hypothetical protein M1814_003084 [Vezdaea aestivalis]